MFCGRHNRWCDITSVESEVVVAAHNQAHHGFVWGKALHDFESESVEC